MPEYGYSVEYRVHLPERGSEAWKALFDDWLHNGEGEQSVRDWGNDPAVTNDELMDLIDDNLVAFAVTKFGGGDYTEIVDEWGDDVWKYEGG